METLWCCFQVTGVLILSALLLLALWVWKASQVNKTFEKIGIKGPKPKPIVGNISEMLEKGFMQCFKEWEKEYGKIYGIYRGQVPNLVVTDLDLIREVMVKNFVSYPNRQTSKMVDYKPWSETLLTLKDDHWKHVRNVLSPTFSSGKLKKMLPVLRRCCQDLLTNIREKAERGEEMDAKEFSSAYSMDVIAGVAFGIQINSLKNPDEQFVKVTNRILYAPPWMLTVLFLVPFLGQYLRHLGIAVAPKDALDYVIDVISSALKQRRQEQQKYPDILQLLVEAETEPSSVQQVDPEIDHRKELSVSSSWIRKGLTEGEIQSNCLLFLLAGYDTTAVAMSFLLFNLAANPHCLRKVQEEIDKKIGEVG